MMNDDFFGDRDGMSKTFSIAQMASSIVSFVSSLLILFIIFRSHKKLTTTFNRLLLGLSISDMISSFAQAFVTIPSPADHIIGWLTVGNMALCRTQGALFTIGSIASPLYNCSICVYYLIEIKFTQYIPSMSRIERYLHAAPILMSLATCISMFAIDAFYPMLTHCFVSAYPFGCQYDESIDCERGVEYKNAPALFIILMFFQIVVPVIIIGSMISIYRDVAAQESRMSRFSFAVRRSSRAVRNRIAARNRAIAYSVAYLLTAMWFFVMVTIIFISGSMSHIPVFVSIAHHTFSPLQGFFNLIVFLHPRVSKYWRIHRRTHSNNLIKVFYLAVRDAILARGPRIGQRSNSSRMTSLRRAGGTNAVVEEDSTNREEVAPSTEVFLSSTFDSSGATTIGQKGQERPIVHESKATSPCSASPLLLAPNEQNHASLNLSDDSVKKSDEVLLTSIVDEEQGMNDPDYQKTTQEEV